MPASQSNYSATEIKAGVFVLTAVVILVVFLAALRGCGSVDDEVKTYYATFSDISGLNRGADVRFGGVKVGRVTDLVPDPADREMIRVTAEVEGDIPVNSGSLASIEQITLTSSKHLEITTGAADAELHSDGDYLASQIGAGAFGLPSLEGLVARLETLIDGLNVVVGATEGESGSVDLGAVLASFKATLDQGTLTLADLDGVLQENRPALKQMIEGLNDLERAAAEVLEQLDAVLAENRAPLNASAKNLEKFTADASRQMEDLGESLKRLSTSLENVGANADDLMDGQRPILEEILSNLQQTTRNLRRLSQTLADRPESLVRGKGSQGRK
jgi:phospholipid/cholesterol/gamma-HCH transport system substrate-binding protein